MAVIILKINHCACVFLSDLIILAMAMRANESNVAKGNTKSVRSVRYEGMIKNESFSNMGSIPAVGHNMNSTLIFVAKSTIYIHRANGSIEI